MSRAQATAAVGSKNTSMYASPICLTILRSEEHTSELQSLAYLVCRLLLEKKKSATYLRHDALAAHTAPDVQRLPRPPVRPPAHRALHDPHPPAAASSRYERPVARPVRAAD